MMQIYNKDNRLESHRIFPYVAWTVVILFALFVLNLVLNIEKRIAALEERSTTVSSEYNVPVNSFNSRNED